MNGVTVLRYIQTPSSTAIHSRRRSRTLAISEADSANGSRRFEPGVPPLASRARAPRQPGRTQLGLRLALPRLPDLHRDAQPKSGDRLAYRPIDSSFVVSAAESFFIDSEHAIQLARHMVTQLK